MYTRLAFPDAIVDNEPSHDLRLMIPFDHFKIEVKTKNQTSYGGWSFLLNRREWQLRWSLFVFVCLENYELARLYLIPRTVLLGKRSVWFSRDNPKHTNTSNAFEKFRII